MTEKTIAVRLHPRLEREGRGLCDPEDVRNSQVITPLNYGAGGYLRVYPSGFIQAQIQAGVLIRVPEGKAAAGGREAPSTRKSRGAKR